MKETVKNLAIILLILAFGFVLGYLVFGRQQIIPENPEPEIIENTQKIDSLLGVIQEKDLDIERLKDSIRIEIIEVEKIKDSIENLPITENVNLLKENIAAFGTHTAEDDTLPQLVKINNDTIVAISEDNLIDVNIAFSELESKIFINNLQRQIIANDSMIINDQRSIITSKDILLEKQKLACQRNTEELTKVARQEKVTRYCWEIGGIVVSASLITLLILQATK